MTGLQMKTLLVTAASALALAACGSAEVASPGEGNFGNGGNNGAGSGDEEADGVSAELGLTRLETSDAL